MVVVVENELGESFVAPVRDRAAGRRPGKPLARIFTPCFCTAPLSGRPRRFRDRCRRPRGSARVEMRLFARGRLGRHMSSCTALWASIGCPTMSPIAKICATFVRIWHRPGSSLDQLLLLPLCPHRSCLRWRRPTATQHKVVSLRIRRCACRPRTRPRCPAASP